MFSPNAASWDIYNWRKRGIPVDGTRVYLGWFPVGSRVFTTEESVIRFANAAQQTLSGYSPKKAMRKRG